MSAATVACPAQAFSVALGTTEMDMSQATFLPYQAAGRIEHYNPFYLLSAICMLAGILMLNNSLQYSPLPSKNLFLLITTLNVYEATLILLGIVLLRRGLLRD